MRLQLTFKFGMPVHLQIVAQVKAAAGSLPSIRALAEDLRNNQNTVTRAYAELGIQGAARNEPGPGCFVREMGQPPFRPPLVARAGCDVSCRTLVQVFRIASRLALRPGTLTPLSCGLARCMRLSLSPMSLLLCIVTFVLTDARGAEGKSSTQPSRAVSASGDLSGRRGEMFRRFLADPPWVKRVLFRCSGNHYGVMMADDPQGPQGRIYWHTGWVLYDGAQQPAGFFLRHLSNSVNSARLSSDRRRLESGPTKAGEEFVAGASARHWWTLDNENDTVVVAPRLAEEGQAKDNGAEVIAKSELKKIETLRFLGMPELGDADNVEWLDTDRFRARSARYGAIEGRITRWNNDLPSQIEYQVEGPPKKQQRVDYRYGPHRTLPPVEMVRRVMRGGVQPLLRGGAQRLLTNRIDQWESGVDARHAAGFKPSEFRQREAKLAFFLVWSNGVRYAMAPDGTMVITSDTPPDYAALGLGGQSRRWSITLTVLGGLLGGGAILFVVTRRSRRTLR